jgi:hypothetical protein
VCAEVVWTDQVVFYFQNLFHCFFFLIDFNLLCVHVVLGFELKSSTACAMLPVHFTLVILDRVSVFSLGQPGL